MCGLGGVVPTSEAMLAASEPMDDEAKKRTSSLSTSTSSKSDRPSVSARERVSNDSLSLLDDISVVGR